MFVISGANLKQWEQGRFLTNEHMAVGDAVQFTNGSGKSSTMYAYEKDGKIVVDVPNAMLKWSGIMTADLIGKDGCFTRLEVEACEKPDGWEPVDNEKVEKNTSGGVSSWNDLTDKPFGDVETVLLSETNLTFAPMEDMGGMDAAIFNFEEEPMVGSTCTVTFNGVDYSCVVVDNGEGGLMFGNFGVLGDADTGEPFFVMHMSGFLTALFPHPEWGLTSAKVSIKSMKAVPIESKYAPSLMELNLVELLTEPINQNDPVEVPVTEELITQLAVATQQGVINVRANFDLHYTDLSYVHDYFGGTGDNFQGVIPCTIHRSMSGQFIIQGFYYDALIFILVNGDRNLKAMAHRMALAREVNN